MQAANPERAKNFKWTRYPGIDEPSKATIGGLNLAVSSLLAAQAGGVRGGAVPAGAGQPEVPAISDGVPPTIESIYTDEEPIEPCPGATTTDKPTMASAYPMKDTILEELKDPAVRPLTVVYQNLSTITSKVLSPPADIDPQATADELRDGLQKALESKGVLP